MSTITGTISDSIAESSSGKGRLSAYRSSSSSMSIASSSITAVSLFVTISEHLYPGGSSGAAKVSLVSISELISEFSSATARSVLHAAIKEGMRIGVQLDFAGLKYDGWVFNANTMAASRYSGFNFNSFFQYQGVYYGVNSSGIHSLDSNDDEGFPIESWVTTGNIKPFAHKQARVPDAYLLVKNSGELYVSVIANGTSYTHQVTTLNPVHNENRVKLGKGTKSVIWKFEIGNVNGSNFDLDSFKIYPIELTRHI